MPPKGERRKQQIINTAKEMFIQNGFQSTHIGQVCEKLNIARGTVYQYFSNKKEILYALLDAVIDKIADVLDQDDMKEFLKTNPGQKEIIDFINKRIASSISMLIEEPIVIKLIFKDIIGIDEEVVKRVNISIEKIKVIIAREIEELKNRGFFKQNLDARITASMLVGGLMLVVYEYDLRKKDVLNKSVVESIANSYLHGAFK